LLDGLSKIPKLVKAAKELGMESLAITDHGSMYGAIEFYKTCIDSGIKPIIGCELYVVPDSDIKIAKEKKFHITALIKNEIGFQNLCKILTDVNLNGFYYKSRTDFKTILEWSEGLVFLTGCGASPLTTEEGIDFISSLAIKNQGDVYLEVMPHLLDDQIELNKLCYELSLDKEFGLQLIATNDCHYIKEKDNLIQEVLLAIQTKAKWNDPK